MISVILFVIVSIVSGVVYYLLHRKSKVDISRLVIVIALPVIGWVMELIDRSVEQNGKNLVNQEGEQDYSELVMSLRPSHTTYAFPLYAAVEQSTVHQRRELMKEAVLSPNTYFHALTAARLDSDTEVVHYATTALVQLREEAEKRLMDARDAWKENSNDSVCRERYEAELRHWLAVGFGGRQCQRDIANELQALLSDTSAENKAQAR